VTEVALRGAALLWDLQTEAARNLWRAQARTAAMLGVPDFSGLFHVGDDRARNLFTTSAEQVLNSARNARETVVEVQRQIGRLAEQHTIGLTEEVRDNIQQIGRRTEQGLQEIKQMAVQQADQVSNDMREGQQRGNGGDEAGRDEQQGSDEQTRNQAGRQGQEAGQETQEAMVDQNAGEGAERDHRKSEERPRARRTA